MTGPPIILGSRKYPLMSSSSPAQVAKSVTFLVFTTISTPVPPFLPDAAQNYTEVVMLQGQAFFDSI
jgi:hypothetical protein